MAKLGFGKPTGIDLIGEGGGVLPSQRMEARPLQPAVVSRRNRHRRHRPGLLGGDAAAARAGGRRSSPRRRAASAAPACAPCRTAIDSKPRRASSRRPRSRASSSNPANWSVGAERHDRSRQQQRHRAWARRRLSVRDRRQDRHGRTLFAHDEEWTSISDSADRAPPGAVRGVRAGRRRAHRGHRRARSRPQRRARRGADRAQDPRCLAARRSGSPGRERQCGRDRAPRRSKRHVADARRAHCHASLPRRREPAQAALGPAAARARLLAADGGRPGHAVQRERSRPRHGHRAGAALRARPLPDAADRARAAAGAAQLDAVAVRRQRCCCSLRSRCSAKAAARIAGSISASCASSRPNWSS